jgi:catechol 2,3-dioxygenase-like lactoylglutathione lyase family enzyme
MMKFGCPLISVNDLNTSRSFYENVLFQKVVLDLGTNISFGDESSVFAIQADYARLVGEDNLNITYGGNDHELYFEESNFDEFEKHLEQFVDIIYIHKSKEYSWGQRVIRFYDPDFHIIEVGESMESVFKKFQNQGMSIDEVAKRTQHPIEFVKKYIM